MAVVPRSITPPSSKQSDTKSRVHDRLQPGDNVIMRGGNEDRRRLLGGLASARLAIC